MKHPEILQDMRSDQEAYKMTLYPVTESFISINGEGRKAGTLSCFLRMRGCNLCCNYCDTRWACEPDAEAKMLSAEDIVAWVTESGIRNITLTGGEPLLTPGVNPLLSALAGIPEAEIEIETNGSVPLADFFPVPDPVFFTMDLKCPGSGMQKHNCMENLSLLRQKDVVKYVVSDRADLDWMRETVTEYRLTERCGIYVGAVFGRIDPLQIVDYLKEYKMNRVHLQLQLHKYIWDPMQRGV